MKKSFLIKEYTRSLIPGTMSMKNVKNFFGSQLIDVEDIIRIDDKIVEWTELFNGTQLKTTNEISKSLSLKDIKGQYQNISLLNQQSTLDKIEFPVWSLKIDLANILIKYLYSQLKHNRTFENIKTTVVKNANIELSIIDFIDQNIFKKYKLSTLLLYIKHIPIDQQYLAYSPIWDYTITLKNGVRMSNLELQTASANGKALLVKNYQLINDFTYANEIEIKYRQTESAKTHTFLYHYDVVFEKI